jgi:hypothetical protein
MESKTDLSYDESLNCFVAKGFIVNLSSKYEKGMIEARFEIIENYESYSIHVVAPPIWCYHEYSLNIFIAPNIPSLLCHIHNIVGLVS